METKHTAGPWEFSDDQPYTDQTFGVRTIEEFPLWIASIYDTGASSIQEAQANARLIAAAPKMLQALIKVIEDCELELNSHGPICVELDEIKDIVSEATGSAT